MDVRQLFTIMPKPFAQFIHQTGTKAQGSKSFFTAKKTRFVTPWKKQNKKHLFEVWAIKRAETRSSLCEAE